MKINKIIIIQVIFWSFFSVLEAQQSVYFTDLNADFLKGKELFEKEKYANAKEYFGKAQQSLSGENTNLKAEAAYYEALCAVKLFNEDAEYLTYKLAGDYPESPLVNQAWFNLGNYFYATKKYSKAIDYYEKTDKQQLKEDDKAELTFKLGYCYFTRNDPEKARTVFSEIKDIDTKYTAPAIYYYAHINYSQGNYQTALNGFQRLADDETFGAIVPYYITQIYFLQKKYDEVISYAPKLMENVTEKRKAEVSRIIGESFYKLNRYKESIPYLEVYMDNAPYVTKDDKYELAYAYYQAGELDKAVKLFENISSGESLISQNSLYHLADCYLKLNDKNKARMAFSSASKMDFDPKIKEDALFNYAMVTYELFYSPFNEAIKAFNDYIRLYPHSKRTDEAYHYLVMAYMNTNNYSQAYESIEKIKNKTPEIKKAYQKIAFYHGLELFNNLRFQDAIDMFDNSSKYGNSDISIGARAMYWKAEALYRLSEYQQAINAYNSFLETPGALRLDESNLVNYNIGYCYFKMNRYQDASLWFRKYIDYTEGTQTQVTADAYNRIGDCYFVNSDYNSAISFYDKAIKTGKTDQDYAMFQKGFSLGLVNKDEQKIAEMNTLMAQYPSSPYADDALYEIGQSYLKLQQYDAAIPSYKKLISNYPNSSYVKSALVKLGLIYYNTNDNQASIKMYKQVVADYPGTDEAKDALTGLKNIYVDMNNVNAYFDYVNSLGSFAKVSTNEQDSLIYTSAEKLYMSGDCENSVKGFENYVRKFPDGNFILNAQFYMGDCNYQQKNYDAAMQSFDYVISKPRNIFTEQALLGASRIQYSQKNYKKALEYYSRLDSVSEVRGNIMEARVGEMRCFYNLQDYNSAIEAAKKVLATEKISAETEREAQFDLAKSLYALDRLVLAREEFSKVATEVNSEEGAESKFRVAEIYYKLGDIDRAEKEIYDFSDKTTPHQYWMAKAFLLWSDIFVKKGDDFQAIQTLQSLIDYYENSTDGILDLAKEKKQKIVDSQEANEKVKKSQDLEINIDKK